MDVQMPEMDGVAATQAIHNEWSIAERPYIIALTANALAGDRERYLALGMDDYLAKPLLMEPLIEALHEAFVGLGKEQTPEISVIDSGHVPASQDLEPIDQAAFLDRLGEGSEALLYQLVAMFLKEADQGLTIFKQGLVDNDRDAVQAIIHKLKGSSSTASAHTFATYCREILELLAQDADLALVAAYLTRLNQALAAVQKWQQEHAPDD
jgi:HPt (histidine-containing phosphotransfer) domain-containing protein